jgi:hypothetical protein
VKDRADVFPFEDREINYSCRKLIEYTGEELNDVTMYWAVEEFLYPGEYRVDIFADNSFVHFETIASASVFVWRIGPM